MTITLNYANKEWEIYFDGKQYIPVKLSTNQQKDSANFGKETRNELGYFTHLSGAIEKIIKEAQGSSEETVTLREYVIQVKEAVNEIREQLNAFAL